MSRDQVAYVDWVAKRNPDQPMYVHGLGIVTYEAARTYYALPEKDRHRVRVATLRTDGLSVAEAHEAATANMTAATWRKLKRNAPPDHPNCRCTTTTVVEPRADPAAVSEILGRWTA